ncbi:hypothetical protein MRB53_022015 [Persea americana]|uniref:Uncharacterized protein n=1 Tax=Persea americana TaxID=3435 RepID=A0ACC2L5F4_PERAE|nr:hypothetical protein MRB53_022015 [Persea americana]
MEEKKRAPVLFRFNQRWGVNEGEFSTAPVPQRKGEGRRAKTRRAGRRDGLAVEIDSKCLETQGAGASSGDGAATTMMPGVGRKVWDSVCGGFRETVDKRGFGWEGSGFRWWGLAEMGFVRKGFGIS